jgi:hypothetical protein
MTDCKATSFRATSGHVVYTMSPFLCLRAQYGRLYSSLESTWASCRALCASPGWQATTVFIAHGRCTALWGRLYHYTGYTWQLDDSVVPALCGRFYSGLECTGNMGSSPITWQAAVYGAEVDRELQATHHHSTCIMAQQQQRVLTSPGSLHQCPQSFPKGISSYHFGLLASRAPVHPEGVQILRSALDVVNGRMKMHEQLTRLPV